VFTQSLPLQVELLINSRENYIGQAIDEARATATKLKPALERRGRRSKLSLSLSVSKREDLVEPFDGRPFMSGCHEERKLGKAAISGEITGEADQSSALVGHISSHELKVSALISPKLRMATRRNLHENSLADLINETLR